MWSEGSWIPFIKITDNLQDLFPPTKNHFFVEADSGLQPPIKEILLARGLKLRSLFVICASHLLNTNCVQSTVVHPEPIK